MCLGVAEWQKAEDIIRWYERKGRQQPVGRCPQLLPWHCPTFPHGNFPTSTRLNAYVRRPRSELNMDMEDARDSHIHAAHRRSDS